LDAVAETFIDFYLHQFFVLGVFHADPHPGNLLVMPDGGLCIHDFGAVGQLDTRSREALLAFVVAFIHLDPDWLTEAAIELGLVSAGADREALGRGIEEILNDLKGAEIADWSLARTMIDIGRLSTRRTLLLPPHLASLVRTAFTAEGALRQMNAEADILRLLQEAGGRMLAGGNAQAKGSGSRVRLEWELASLLRRAPGLATAWIRKVSDDRLARPFTPSSGQNAARRPLAEGLGLIALSIVALGAYVAAAILMLADQAEPLWGIIPLPAAISLVLALWLTALVLVRSRRLRRGEP
jgi:ubiquinone biosynthesis protein